MEIWGQAKGIGEAAMVKFTFEDASHVNDTVLLKKSTLIATDKV